MIPILALALALALAAAAFYFVLPALAKVLLRRRFLARVRAGGCACLSFDDGPDPAVTPAIAEELARAGVRATFFMIGERAARHPEIAARLLALGHEIGEHGQTHTHAWKSAPWTTARDLWRGGAALSLNGAAPACLRPPFGKLNLVTLIYSWRARRPLVFWDIDPRDYVAGATPAAVAGHVLERLGPGRVVLLHDGRVAPGSDPAVTLEAVRLILARTAGGPLRFAPLGEALALPSTHLPITNHQPPTTNSLTTNHQPLTTNHYPLTTTSTAPRPCPRSPR